jgi:hypothetical protein
METAIVVVVVNPMAPKIPGTGVVIEAIVIEPVVNEAAPETVAVIDLQNQINCSL